MFSIKFDDKDHIYSDSMSQIQIELKQSNNDSHFKNEQNRKKQYLNFIIYDKTVDQ